MADGSPATLYGLGVGPGDPSLLTLKALEILKRVEVIAYLEPQGSQSLARSIVAGHLPGGQIEVVIRAAMVPGETPAIQAYDRAAERIAGHLDAGREVAVLCEGDPFFYGSFIYLFERLGESHTIEVVPGVSSLGAASAAAGMPLASRAESLAVVAATLCAGELERRLKGADAAAILKVGRHLGKVRRVLGRLGAEAGAYYIERATMAGERVLPLSEAGDDKAPYFSLILARMPKEAPPANEDIPEGTAVVVLGEDSMKVARKLCEALPGAVIHRREGRAGDAEVTFSEVGRHLRRLFAEGTPIAGVCAAGILIRALAPRLADKRAEPPVVAVAADGSIAVPLLGGHGGANRLARAIAAATGGTAAITTAGDVRFALALDDPPPGWTVANPEAAKGIAAALLAGRPVGLKVEAGDAGWLESSGAAFSAGGDPAVRVTDRTVVDPGDDLVLHPPVLALGVGCERGAGAGELQALAEEALRRHGLAAGSVACVVSIDVKADEAAVHALAAGLGVPARFFSPGELEAEAPRLANPSDAVFEAVGCHGVAEGAALAAAGPGGGLAIEKTAGARTTCAVARAPSDIDPSSVGRPQGSLAVVGIGPGADCWRTPEASRALDRATDVVGYKPYLELIADVVASKALYSSPMTHEEGRVRTALDLAAEGRAVALVSSGDAGIYALAALVFELLDLEDNPCWNRVSLTVCPGVSAFQAAAARIGAPAGHDFCAISLSDLLTPMEEIERRLEAAARGDFVLALYNPVSKRRRKQLVLARDILLKHRPADTPVVLARNVGREGETVDVVRLDELTPDLADMLTVILIGNSRTRTIERGVKRWVYTPRGYANKRKADS